MLSFTSYMTTWAEPFYYKNAGEIVTTSTPLASETPAKLADLFFGTTGGCIGETCALALLIGGVFLVAIRVISPVTPISFIGTVFVLSIFTTGSLEGAVAAILSGGLMLGVKAAVTAALIAIVTGAVYGVILKSVRRNDEESSNAFAFGPFLIVGLAVGAFFGGSLIDMYLSRLHIIK